MESTCCGGLLCFEGITLQQCQKLQAALEGEPSIQLRSLIAKPDHLIGQDPCGVGETGCFRPAHPNEKRCSKLYLQEAVDLKVMTPQRVLRKLICRRIRPCCLHVRTSSHV